MPKFRVKTSEAGQRADKFLAGRYPRFARSSLKGLFDQAKVKLGSGLLKPGHKLHSGDNVTVDDQLLNHRPEALDLPIIYEDENMVVINKPSGILSHSKGALNIEATVADFLRPKLNDQNLSGNRAGIVHRLDRATSGVMIMAKNKPTLDWLQKQFSTRQVKKTYLAIVADTLTPAEALIDAPIGRNPAEPKSFKVTPRGRPAQTHYKLLKAFSKGGRQYALVELSPLTGRTHQLRVHLKYIGHPVVGDQVYGAGGDKLYLHAAELAIKLPSGEPKIFKAPLTSDFKTFQTT